MATTKTKDVTPQTRWSKEISDGNMTKRLSVESVENGFIITINKYGDEGEGEYQYVPFLQIQSKCRPEIPK